MSAVWQRTTDAEVQVVVWQKSFATDKVGVASAPPKFKPWTVKDENPVGAPLGDDPEATGASNEREPNAVPISDATVRVTESSATIGRLLAAQTTDVCENQYDVLQT